MKAQLTPHERIEKRAAALRQAATDFKNAQNILVANREDAAALCKCYKTTENQCEYCDRVSDTYGLVLRYKKKLKEAIRRYRVAINNAGDVENDDSEARALSDELSDAMEPFANALAGVPAAMIRAAQPLLLLGNALQKVVKQAEDAEEIE